MHPRAALGFVDERVDERGTGQSRERTSQLEQSLFAETLIAPSRVPLEQSVGEQQQAVTLG